MSFRIWRAKDMLPHFDDLTSDRQRRLFGCACCRSIWSMLGDERSQRAVEVAERYADELASAEELSVARAAAREVLVERVVLYPPSPTGRVGRLDPDAAALHNGLAMNPAAGVPLEVVAEAVYAARAAEIALMSVSDWSAVLEAETAERGKQDLFLKDIVRPPLLPPPLSHAILEWNDRTVPLLAEVIYADRHLPDGTLDNTRLAILADALQDAGCEDEQILAHCRDATAVHVRGCWVVDLILGRR